MHVNPILEMHVDSGLAVFRVGSCSIEVNDCSIKAKDCSIILNHPPITVHDCFILFIYLFCNVQTEFEHNAHFII